MVDILYQKWDEKARMWSRALEKLGHRCSGLTMTPIGAPAVLWWRRPDVYIVRYLNDYPSFGRTLLRAISEFLLVQICRWLKIQVVWLLHNVDQESSQSWPRITLFRRRTIAQACHRGFVTDPLLIGEAKQRFSSVDWDAVSFGIETNVTMGSEAGERVLAAISRLRTALGCWREKPVYIGLAVTSISDKYLHLARYRELVANDPDWPFRIGLVFVGDFAGAGAPWRNLAMEMGMHNSIEVVDIVARIDEPVLGDSFDFVYRSLSDLSVPYTLYRAAAAGKPLITHDAGFLPRLVREFGIGVIWDEADFGRINDFFSDWQAARWSRFLAERSWQSGLKFVTAGS